jgi:hypothetical protein
MSAYHEVVFEGARYPTCGIDDMPFLSLHTRSIQAISLLCCRLCCCFHNGYPTAGTYPVCSRLHHLHRVFIHPDTSRCLDFHSRSRWLGNPRSQHLATSRHQPYIINACPSSTKATACFDIIPSSLSSQKTDRSYIIPTQLGCLQDELQMHS